MSIAVAEPVAAAFLDHIVAYPEEDAPRLIFADWLDEHGAADRAEFIRGQCELARLGSPDPPDCGGYYCDVGHDGHALHRDCRFTTLKDRQDGLMGCESFPSWCPRVVADTVNRSTYRRGFIAEVSLPCAAWLRHGPALVRAAPLQVVRPADKAPWHNELAGGGEYPYHWWPQDDDPDETVLPDALFRRLPPGPVSGTLGCKLYASEAAAADALSAACLAFARDSRPWPAAVARALPGPLPRSPRRLRARKRQVGDAHSAGQEHHGERSR